MNDRELLQQALEALDGTEALLSSMDVTHMLIYGEVNNAITVLRERLAQPEQEPFCYHDGRNIVGKEYSDHSDVFPLYTAPQPRQWRGLTEEDLFDIAIVNFGEPDLQLFIEMGKLVQEELKEKNT